MTENCGWKTAPAEARCFVSRYRPPVSRSPPMMLSSQCVFIVDDEAWVRDSLAVLLDLKGYRTQAFASAEEFLKNYRPASAGCLLLDIRMPGMSGLELQAALHERQVKLPIIVISA